MIEDVKEKALKEGVPLIKDEGLAFLLDLIEKRGFRQILELGTAVGYSAIEMASLNEDIHVDTIEKKEDMYLQAVRNIDEAGLSKRIRVFHEAIEDHVPDREYDLIFVDAAKAQYHSYLEQYLGCLKEDGVMVFDNMIFHGLIYEIEGIRSRALRALVNKIARFRRDVQNDKRFDIMIFDDIGDGILMLSRRKCEA